MLWRPGSSLSPVGSAVGCASDGKSARAELSIVALSSLAFGPLMAMQQF